jgi:autotransporter-associated beta strand protein
VPVTTVFDLNGLSAASGHASVGLLAGINGAAGGTATVQLNLGNGTTQPGLGRALDLVSGSSNGLTGTVEFNSNNEIPGLTGSRSRLFLAPGSAGIPTRNGVIVSGTAADQNSPSVVLTGTVPGVGGLGGRFAAINPGTGEVTAQTGTTRTEANLSSATATENVVYRPTNATANATLTNNIAPQTVIFEPRGNGQSVNLNGFTLTTNGLMFSGREITGTGTYIFSINGGTLEGAGGALRNFFVLGGSNNILNVSSNLAGSTGTIVKAGGGTLALTGTTVQLADGSVFLNQGALRARVDGPNQNFGPGNTVWLRGGVLEVDANGGTTTITPTLGIAAPGMAVNWTGGTDLGSVGGGGFAATNGNLNVNIGAGQTLTWNGTSGGSQFFVRSGHPLRFGTAQSTGIVTLVNNLALDDGSAGLPREARQIITEGAGSGTRNFDPAVRTRITGVISGSAATSLVKLGGTILELSAANTYAGGTSVDVGTLMVSNTSGSATGTGRVVVNDVLIGTGTIAPTAGNGLTMMPNSFLILDREFGTPGHLTVGTAGLDNPVTLRPTAAFASRINGTTFDPAGGATSYGRLTVRGTGTITLTGAILGVGIPTTFTPAPTDAFAILDNQTAGGIVGTFNGIGQDQTVNVTFPDNSFAGTFRVSYTGNVSGGTVTPDGGNDVVLYGFTPVPEPGSVLGLAAAAAAGAGLARRFRRTR